MLWSYYTKKGPILINIIRKVLTRIEEKLTSEDLEKKCDNT